MGVGVDLEMFQPSPVAEARGKLRLDPETTKYIGFTGTLDAWQGLELLFDAVKKLGEIYRPFRVIIVGFGRQEQAYRDRADQLQISEYVRFIGRVSHDKIADYIRACHICVIPRTEDPEGYAPIKLLEYLACGRPVVASRIKGFEILESHRCGLTYDAGSSDSLCRMLRQILQDNDLWYTLSENARQIAVSRYSWDHIARGVLSELGQI